jgi:general secretion pathway protein D
MTCLPRFLRSTAVAGLLITLLMGSVAPPAEAQRRPDRRNTRTDISPELLVSFEKDTPLNQFIELINPIVERELDKRVVDPQNRSVPIGVPVSGMHYLDALNKVLAANDLTYQETETVFLVKEPTQTTGAAPTDTTEAPPATLGTREIRINAVLFNLNLTKVRDRGLRWDEILGSTTQQGGGGGGGGGVGGGGGGGGGQGGQGGGQQGQFFIETDNLFDSVDDILQAPEQITLSQFRSFLNLIEQENMGKTIANPQVTVQSGEQGQIQIGQDVPIQTTDFAGNTVTEFVSTGIIIDVTPTLLSQPVADTAGAPILDFIHMDVQVEDSNSQPSAAGTIINRNQATTQVLLLDEEATAIGGLISTQKTISRSGVPILKDLPGWFFGLRYIFGTTTKNVSKRELVIMLEAEVVKPLRARAEKEMDQELLDQRRQEARETLRKLGEEYPDDAEFPKAEENSEPREE